MWALAALGIVSAAAWLAHSAGTVAEAQKIITGTQSRIGAERAVDFPVDI